MATAHGVVIVGDKIEQYSVTARVVPDGRGHLYLKGKVADSFPQVFGATIASVRQYLEFMDVPNLDCADINLRINMPNNYPLAGGSHAVTIGIAILAAATSKVIPAGYCYTGGLNRYGDTQDVDYIAEKRRGAAGFGFDRLFLPASQIDMFSTYIAQCPIKSLADAYGITFWNER